MASNSGPSKPREAPSEPFKRSVAATLRAIAGKSELEVSYAPERAAADRRARRGCPSRRGG